MNKEFNYIGAYTGEHSRYSQMTCINYAAGYVAKGEPDPLEKQVDEFLKEEAEFEMPSGVSSWKQRSEISVTGAKAVKITVRTCKMKNGGEKKIEVIKEKILDLVAKSN